MVRAEPDGGFERGAGAVDVPGPPASRAEMVLCVEESWLQLHGARKMHQRDVGLAELSPNVAETIVRRGKLWRSLQCAFVRLSGAGEILRLFLRLTEKKERVRR